MDGPQPVSPDPKQIQHDTGDRQEALRVPDGGETAHLALAVVRRLVRGFGTIVLVLLGAVDDGRHERALRCAAA